MIFDDIWDYEETAAKSNDEIMDCFNQKYPDYDISRFGLDWRDNKKYILKARGGEGDLIIGWEGVHDWRDQR